MTQKPTKKPDLFVPEGDERCGMTNIESRATCLLPRGHEGPHRNTQGYWSRLPQFNAPSSGDFREQESAQ